ncbi:efflux RND transporter periplasmic adaptor subunit [Arcicella lustrica]|uniref:Efflux RND transporter periplasmic adaptor subunit n=1 Tax=Arcicella lustrica TaxID=2984196 RepID=A0ABU5SQR3_9BACT|nr:efflux RND transporter periplasmic adaptor subunit [Arcicella sp. DC25W]MEA5429646.1 efflux RND transporter periplasmic adaptor subunit [Arcicella sp. DC25W]
MKSLLNKPNTSKLAGLQLLLVGSMLTSTLFLTSCSKPVDKKAELAALKAEQKELDVKIKALEKEVGLSSEKTEAKIVTVAVTPIQAESFKHFVEVQGVVTSKNILQVTPQMAGTITSLLIAEGQSVKKGQLVATIDNNVLKESLAEIKHQLELAVTLYNKQKTLWDQQIGTEVQYLQAKANKESLEKRIVTMDAQLAMSKVYAPISGTVEKVNQKAGEMGSPGVAIAQIVNVGDLKITAKIADTYVGSVKQGASMTVKFPDINKELNTRISVVNALVDPLSRTFGIEANIPNLGGNLKPNQVAIVNINDLTKANSLVVNQNIIQKTELGDIVYVAVTENGKKIARSKVVKKGIAYNGSIEILEGLAAGDLVITQGYQELVDGTPVAY